MPDILVVDDDAHIRDVLGVAAESAGFNVQMASDGTKALSQFSTRTFDLIILDIGMPERDGLEVCREIRKTSQVPILFLTARSDEIDRVLGLEMGGDDYVTKPFSPREVVARVRAILKRTAANAPEPQILAHGLISVDHARFACTVGETEVHLTNSEFSVLRALIRRPDVVMSRVQLIDFVYGHNTQVSDRTLDSHVRNLRSKLAEAGCEDAIKTIHGVGLRLGPCS